MASSFFWYELMTTDVPAAETFYRNVVGWNSQPFESSGIDYVVFNAGERAVCGLMLLPEEAKAMGTPPCWMGYIHAKDVDAATASVKKAGGTVHREPSDIPEVGRFSVVADPQGAAFMLMTPQGPDQEPLAPDAAGNVGWRELYTTDWQAAFGFYSTQFGWTKDEAMEMGEMGTYQVFAIDGQQAGGMMNKPPQMPAPAWTFYFTVDDINAATERVKAGGGTVLLGPLEVPGGSWMIQAQDPQGAIFALVKLAG